MSDRRSQDDINCEKPTETDTPLLEEEEEKEGETQVLLENKIEGDKIQIVKPTESKVVPLPSQKIEDEKVEETQELLANQNEDNNPVEPTESTASQPMLKQSGKSLSQEDIDNEIMPSSAHSDKSIAAVDVNTSKCNGCFRAFGTARFQVYLSHFLSSWGDRMWMFAGGLFLLEVTPGSLRLAAVYGAALALTVIIFGAPIGRLVDRTSRLKMAQVSLCVQNIMVCVCAAILVAVTTKRHLFTAWNGWALVVAEGFVILTACIAQIGTLGSKLTIEKDWILVICGQDQARLAGMNSVLRALDLSTEVLAPVIVGTVMTTVGMAAGGIFIASWNVGSLIIEYGLLHYLYHSNADLQKPKMAAMIENQDNSAAKAKISAWKTLKQRFSSAWGAWISYMTHPVRDAGLGLALLYMTVLAFDNYSRAFVFESGVSESILGILTAVASLFGIFGALLYPKLRVRFGVTTTGLIGFGVETFCLTFCVASVFSPGSPFDASALISGNEYSTQSNLFSTVSPIGISNSVLDPNTANLTLPSNSNSQNVNKISNEDINTSDESKEEFIYTSVILLLIGIITSRTGLWLADLTVTQILQEGVEERQRGAINGVQSSLNQSLDLFRSILIIILPTRATFGFLIILSFIFVASAWCLFGVYARRTGSKNQKIQEPEEQRLEQANV